MLFKKIAIVGVGLIGGSIGLAVKKRKLAGEVLGLGRSELSLKKALKKKAIDKIVLDKSELQDVDLIILSTPVGKITPLVKELLPYIKNSAIITDVGSTKEQITKNLKKILPPNIFFIGAHPLAGSEKSGVDFSNADLFEKSICFLTPCKNKNAKEPFEKIKKFWTRLGAEAIAISAKEHDFLMAGISHLPHIVSIALVNSASGVKWKGKEITEFAGQGWKDATRISRGSPEVWIDILSSNADKLLLSIKRFDKEWNTIKKLLKNGKIEKLKKILEKASEKSS